MAKVLVLYYSAYGHIETMANAVAEGAREAGATVDIKRVPELVPEAVAKASHYKLDQAASTSTSSESSSAVIVSLPSSRIAAPSRALTRTPLTSTLPAAGTR